MQPYITSAYDYVISIIKRQDKLKKDLQVKEIYKNQY